MIRFLMDENMPHAVRDQLLRREPTITIFSVGDDGSPAIGTSDPDILKWIEEIDTCLVSRNRRSMPDHLTEHVSAGGHVPGIFLIKRDQPMGKVIDDLLLIWHASEADELRDCVIYLPL